MFQTGIHLALQSLASDALTWFMLNVTALGYHRVIVLIVIAVLFGISLRKGFLLFQVIFWTAAISQIAKEFFGLPRPFFADSRVACLEPSWDTSGAFRAMGGGSFFSLPPQPVIDAFRLRDLSFGFPSGHTSSAFAVWGGLAVVFRKRWLAWLAPFMIALIAFSRLYLGVHFLVDIIGGAVLGALMLFGAWRLWRDDHRREELFLFLGSAIAPSLPQLMYLFFLFGLPLLLAAFSLVSMPFTGVYIGLNAAFIVISHSGLPGDRGSFWMRLGRVFLGGILFWLTGLALQQAVILVPAFAGSPWGRLLHSGLRVFLSVWIGMRLFTFLGLYSKEAPTP